MALSKKYPIIRPVIIVILNILDILLTYYLLSKDPTISEANPVGRYLIGLGWGYAIFFKMFLILVTLALLIIMYGRGRRKAINWALNMLMIIYIFVVLNNSYYFFLFLLK